MRWSWLLLTAAACRGPAVPVVPTDRAEPAVAEATARETLDWGATSAALDFGTPFDHDDGDGELGRVGGTVLRKHHVFDRLLEVDPQRARELVELMLLDARVRPLAAKLGVVVPDSDLDLSVRREWALVERAFRRRPAGAKSVGDYVKANYAMDAPAFRAHVRLLTWRRLMRSYVLRYDKRRRGRVRVLWFRCDDEQLARDCHTRVRAGADFGELARRHSADRSAANGGQLPDLPLDLAHPALVVQSGVSAGLLSPVRRIVDDKDHVSWGFVRVLERRAPDLRPFDEQVAELRRELEKRPVTASELALFLLGS